MRELQRQNLAPWLSKQGLVTWVDGLDGLAPQSVTGLFFSNELIDAFPVHRIQVTAERTEELCVDYRDGRFVDCLKPLSTAALAQYLQELDTTWPEGYRTEVNIQAMDWMEQVARRMDRGFVLTIDYVPLLLPAADERRSIHSRRRAGYDRPRGFFEPGRCG
jgi:SAM-dependent MidA family methyltransferase